LALPLAYSAQLIFGEQAAIGLTDAGCRRDGSSGARIIAGEHHHLEVLIF
jgi:hypothetical protein